MMRVIFKFLCVLMVIFLIWLLLLQTKESIVSEKTETIQETSFDENYY